jgi:hypothetical protein
MTTEEFVGIIQVLVRDAAVGGTLEVVRKPPGRRPAKQLLELNQWLAGLSDHDQQMLTKMLQLVAHDAVFGLLNVLDGTRQVEATPEKGRFELRYVKGTTVSELTADPLHEFLGPIW